MLGIISCKIIEIDISPGFNDTPAMLRTNASIIPLLRYKHQFFKSRNSAFFGLQVLVAEIM